MSSGNGGGGDLSGCIGCLLAGVVAFFALKLVAILIVGLILGVIWRLGAIASALGLGG